jgi:hypothetical protein
VGRNEKWIGRKESGGENEMAKKKYQKARKNDLTV